MTYTGQRTERPASIARIARLAQATPARPALTRASGTDWAEGLDAWPPTVADWRGTVDGTLPSAEAYRARYAATLAPVRPRLSPLARRVRTAVRALALVTVAALALVGMVAVQRADYTLFLVAVLPLLTAGAIVLGLDAERAARKAAR